MSLYDSLTYIHDLQTVSDALLDWDRFAGKSILVTGASGLIGSAVLDLLLLFNESKNAGIHIYAAGRSEARMRARFERFFDSDAFHYIPYEAGESVSFDFHTDYIIHAASNAYPAVIAKYPVETMLDNFYGMYQLLQYAGTMDGCRVLFVSSSEVYGAKHSAKPFDEMEYGFVDLLNPRSAYPSGKRAAETLCASFAKEYGQDVVIARPGHVYGPTASKEDNRVSSAFAYAAAMGQDVILKSDGRQIRSYCYMLDCAAAILTILTRGKSGEAYNISNPDSILSIREMAELLAKSGKSALRFTFPTDEEKAGFNPMDNSSLSSVKLESLGWKGRYSACEGSCHTVQILKEVNDAKIAKA